MKRIHLYDFAGREIIQFAQWDTDVSITIKGADTGDDTAVVYFYPHAAPNAYKATATVSGDGLICTAPSIALRYGSPVTVTVGYERDGDEYVTPYATIVPVLKRGKPTDYVDDVDPEWSDISEQAKELIKEMTAILEEFEAAQSSGLTLPTVTTSDNGKILQVVDGKWVAAEVEIGTSLTSAEGVEF